MTSETSVPERGAVDMIQELLELAREQSHVLSEKQNINADKKERAEIIIKILKEGVFNGSPFSSASSIASVAGSLSSIASVAGSLNSGRDFLRDWNDKETREKLEKELLDIALGRE
jgi:type I site-specific restriction endonuclease